MSVNGYKLGMGIGFGMSEISDADRIKAIADAGFDAAFSGWKPGNYLKEISAKLKDAGLIYQSVHAPFNRVNKLWEDGDDADAAEAELLACIDDCADAEVPIMISHVWIGFLPEAPTDTGIRRFGKLIRRAEERGVRIALENTEGEGYLEYLWKAVSESPAVGFCIDTGHELCYNRGRDMITKYGSGGKLIATHINDNFGVTGDKITWLDDAHLLPFDGSADWAGIAERFASVGYGDILTCELTTKSKPERDTHKIYGAMDHRQFTAAAYERMARFAGMCKKK